MKKVFFIIPGLTRGGAERVISILSNSLTEKGYLVTLVLLNAGEQAYNLNPKVNITFLHEGKRKLDPISRTWCTIKSFTKLWSLINKERPQFLISFTTNANMWAGIMGNLFGVPYVVSERSNPKRTVAIRNFLTQRFLYHLYRKAKALVVPSQGIKLGVNKLKGFGGLTNFEIIPNPVTEFTTFSLQPVYPRKFILSVGRLHPVKAFDRLIDAFKAANIPDVDLLIVGEGPERPKLEAKIRELNLTDRVVLVGAKDNVQDYYKQSQLYVLSSHYEGYPNVLIEAMSLGCPVIAVDCDFGPRDIITHGENGLLVSQGDIGLLAASIRTLMNDESLKKRFSVNGKTAARENSIETVLSKWEALIAPPTAIVSLVSDNTSMPKSNII